MVDYRSRLAACVPDVLVLPCRPRMDATFTTALVLFVPVSVLSAYSLALLVRCKALPSVLQFRCRLPGVVVFTHVAEVLHLSRPMRLGEPDSVGHYHDLSSAMLGQRPEALTYQDVRDLVIRESAGLTLSVPRVDRCGSAACRWSLRWCW